MPISPSEPEFAAANDPRHSALAIDCAAEADRIAEFLVQTVRSLNRRGLVVAVSGGVDSALCLMLAVRAVGVERVLALLMPERDSSGEGTTRARLLCERLRVRFLVEDISASLAAIGCYRRRDEAIRWLIPGYRPDWRHKLVISPSVDGRIPHFEIVVEDPEGQRSSRRIPSDVYLQIVAATNFKQRIRKTIEYYHAERSNYAVLGTPNKLEYELGFFVRGGDGLADIKPIAHLYKTQVYALAQYLGVPEDIRRQPPSTDTYSLPQTQEEFYFALSYDRADLVLHAMCNAIEPCTVAARLGMSEDQVRHIFRDFDGKRRVARRSLRGAFVLGEAGADKPAGSA